MHTHAQVEIELEDHRQSSTGQAVSRIVHIDSTQQYPSTTKHTRATAAQASGAGSSARDTDLKELFICPAPDIGHGCQSGFSPLSRSLSLSLSLSFSFSHTHIYTRNTLWFPPPYLLALALALAPTHTHLLLSLPLTHI